MKQIKVVKPYQHQGYLNFKMGAYDGWGKAGGDVKSGHYPWRLFHGLAYRFDLPSVRLCNNEALLMFVEPVSITFDTFPYYITHEIIPFIWDCWPCYYDKMERWMKRHKVRTAFFTSSQEMAEMQRRLPDVKMIHCPEAVDTSLYTQGQELKDRSIDLLEFGRSNEKFLGKEKIEGINHVCTKVGGVFIYNNEELYRAIGDAKISICLPKSMTHPEVAQGVETLTQRYWECMLSRTVLLGHAPKELIDLVGYNPVVEADREHVNEQILDMLAHIEDYQELADRNRQVALEMGDWKVRMSEVRDRLRELGYDA